jgi:hypothetical protein
MSEVLALALAACISGDATCRHDLTPHGVIVYVCGVLPPGAHTQSLAETAWTASVLIAGRPHHYHVAARCHNG